MKQIDLEPNDTVPLLNLIDSRLVEVREQLWANQKALWVIIALLGAIAVKLWFFS